MKNIALLIFTAFCVLGCCSCATYVTTEDGSRYKALSRSQIEHLVTISRASLHDSLTKGMITRVEYYDAIHSEPMVRVDYRGDRFGTATVSWRTRGRLLEFRYEDDLTAKIIQKCLFSTSIIPPQERRIQPDKSIRTGR